MSACPEENPPWKNALRGALRNSAELNEFFGLGLAATQYKIFLPLNFAQKIKSLGPLSALWKQFIPDEREDNLPLQESGLYDPIGDQVHSPLPGLVHRYQNRVLFFPTATCPIQCRYCFRKNELEDTDDLFMPKWDQILNYINQHQEINELIFSGGDPFILSNQKIHFLLTEFAKIPHLRFVRFHTRTPIILPERFDASLFATLAKFKPSFKQISIVVHVNHLEEIDFSVEEVLKNMAASHLVFSQSVLLKGVNDSAQDLENLFSKLAELGVIPYYLHHPDQVKGAMHFTMSLEVGRRIYGQLQNRLPGWMIPKYVLDIPGGDGKVSAFNPESYAFSGQLLNKNGALRTIDL